jgi:hypothetical protein
MRPILLVALLCVTSPIHSAEDHWRKLPYPPGRADRVSEIALEGETLWAMYPNVVYWDGTTWRKPTGPALQGGMYLAKFLGGGSRPLYCTQPSRRDKVGRLLKLSKGTVEPVLEFAFDRPTDPPGIWVSRDGKFLNFTQGNFSVFDDGKWADFPLSEEGPHLTFDAGEKVNVYFPVVQKLFTVGPRNQVTQRDIELPFGPTPAVRGALLGKQSALLLAHDLKKTPVILNLDTGEIDVARVPDLTYCDALAMQDGATLLLARGQEPGMRLHRFSSSGDFSEVPGSRGIRWDGADFRPASIAEGNNGELWIGGRGQPILRLTSRPVESKPESNKAANSKNATASIRQFGPETGLNLMDCHELDIDQSGNLFAASSHGIYKRFENPPEGQVSPRRPQVLGQPLWKWQPKEGQIRGAWNLGDALVLASGNVQITCLSPSGEVNFQARIEGDSVVSPSLVRSTDKSTVKFGSPVGIVSLDAVSGERSGLVPVTCDARIAPVSTDDGHLIVRPGRSEAIEKVDDGGETLWKTKLPGYVLLHPVLQGNFAIVQTREGSYGGQATVCIDIRKGNIVWQDVTDAYGVGAAFARKGELIVEADQKMSPAMTSGVLICRDLANGKRRWEYSVDGSINHPPIAAATEELVFAVFSRGEVACLNAEDGRLVWKRELPDNAFDGEGLSHHPAWCPHSMQGNQFLVVDCNQILHVFDPLSGEIHTEVLLSSLPGETLVAPPRLTDNALIVPLNTGVTAYRWPPELP